EGTVTAALWLAIGLAVAGGIGIALLILVILRFNKPGLAERIAPQLRGHSAVNPTEQPGLTTLGTLSKLVAPVIQTGVEQLNKLNLGNNQLAARLAQAGSRLNVSDYRAQQLITAACFAGLASAGCGTAAANLALLALSGLLVVIPATTVYFVARDSVLTDLGRKRRPDLLAEVPTSAGLPAPSGASAGSARGALARVATTAYG